MDADEQKDITLLKLDTLKHLHWIIEHLGGRSIYPMHSNDVSDKCSIGNPAVTTGRSATFTKGFEVDEIPQHSLSKDIAINGNQSQCDHPCNTKDDVLSY